MELISEWEAPTPAEATAAGAPAARGPVLIGCLRARLPQFAPARAAVPQYPLPLSHHSRELQRRQSLTISCSSMCSSTSWSI
jgi:hypothetical protein